MKPSRDPSIDQEPHLRGGAFQGDESEGVAAGNVARNRGRQSLDERVEHSVWDEPGLSGALAGPTPKDGLTYARWLDERTAATPAWKTWLWTILFSLLAGPWALLGAFCGSGGGGMGLASAVLFAPLAEEVMKTALVLWVVEKRPFLFRSSLQIALCAVLAAACFSAVENVLYIFVYLPQPVAPGLIVWRWTVCVTLHTTCSLIASLGLVRVWLRCTRYRTPPELSLGYPFLVTAIVLHAVYNAFAILLDAFNYQF